MLDPADGLYPALHHALIEGASVILLMIGLARIIIHDLRTLKWRLRPKRRAAAIHARESSRRHRHDNHRE